MQNTHIVEDARRIYGAMRRSGVVLMNRPLRDARMIEEAGISLDRALFPVAGRRRPFRPHWRGRIWRTVRAVTTRDRRQVAKLEMLGLVKRRTGQADRRVSEAVITSKGRAMTKAIDKARDHLLTRMLVGWTAKVQRRWPDLLRRLADDALAFEKFAAGEGGGDAGGGMPSSDGP